jgi:hypothetical protein
MVELLPGLHDPDNAGLNLVLPVLVNLLLGLVALWLGLSLPGARLLDLHPVITAKSVLFIPIIMTKECQRKTVKIPWQVAIKRPVPTTLESERPYLWKEDVKASFTEKM